jgi:hypothetical protein
MEACGSSVQVRRALQFVKQTLARHRFTDDQRSQKAHCGSSNAVTAQWLQEFRSSHLRRAAVEHAVPCSDELCNIRPIPRVALQALLHRLLKSTQLLH